MIAKDIKKLLLKISILLIPIILWVMILKMIDPFNYFSNFSLVEEKTKQQTARKLNSLLYNTIYFKNNPTPNIIIGDSRIKRLPISEIEKISGDKYFILHSNAAKLNEIIDLFWLSTKYSKLENVILGINFNLYNKYAYANRVDEVDKIIENPLLYIFNGSVLEVTSKAILHYLTSVSVPNIERNIMLKRALKGKSFKDKKIWWEFNIKTVAKNQYSRYRYPENLIIRLTEVDRYCAENNIKLTLLNVPHHKDYRDRVIDFKLSKAEERYKNDIKNIGNVIDYDFPNSITNCKSCFTDPIHTNDSVSLLMVNEIFTDSFSIGKKL